MNRLNLTTAAAPTLPQSGPVSVSQTPTVTPTPSPTPTSNRLNLTGNKPGGSITQLLKPGLPSVIDLSGPILEHLKKAPIGQIVSGISESFKQKSLEPLKTAFSNAFGQSAQEQQDQQRAYDLYQKSRVQPLTDEEKAFVKQRQDLALKKSMDLVTGFMGESGAIKAVGEDVIKELAAAKDLPAVKGVLEKAGVVVDDVGNFLERLVGAKKPAAVQSIVDEAASQGALKTVGATAEKEVQAVKNDIVKASTPEEAAAITNRLGLTAEDIAKYTAEHGPLESRIVNTQTADEAAQLLRDLKATATQETLQGGRLLSAERQALPEVQAAARQGESQLASKEGSSLPGSLPPESEAVKQANRDAVTQLTQALQEAKPLRGEQERLYTQARQEKLAKVLAVRAQTGGEAGFYRELGQLKGEMPKVEFESLRAKVTQPQIDALFNLVRDSQVLSDFDKITAREGLAKMFGAQGGKVPTDGELKLLGRVFPKEVISELLAKRPFLTRLYDTVSNVLNVPRAIRASFDLSAPFRQGLAMIGKREFWQAMPDMFKYFASEEGFKAAQQSIMRRPTFPLMEEAKLALTGMDELITAREEQFMSNLAEKIPAFGKLIRASGRAYTGFINQVRADVFDSVLRDAKAAGVEIDREGFLKSLGSFINSATGRGSLGALERAAPILNATLFSPRLMASRINMLNPYYYTKLDPFVRQEAIKTVLKFGALATTVLTLAKFGGADIVADPRNADFGKIKFKAEGDIKGLISALPGIFGVGVQTYAGNTRLDILGGFQQYLRLASQLISGQIVSSTTGKTLTLGEGYKPLTRKDIIIRFFEGKESPIASFISNMLTGQDIIGNKFKFGPAVLNLFVPMITQDIKDAISPPGPIGGSGTKKSTGGKNRLNL